MSKLIEKWRTEYTDPKGVSDALYGFEETLKLSGKYMLYEALGAEGQALILPILHDLLKMEAALHEDESCEY